MPCKNKVDYYLPVGYHVKKYEVRCGSTDPYGDRAMCDACEDKYRQQYPQGWRNVPGDTCPHGNYVGDPYGPDLLCGQCESGED